MRRQLFAALFAVAVVAAVALQQSSFKVVPTAQAVSTTVVISQVYGGAGCGTAGCSTYRNDYIELFNRGTSAVSLNGWSVQYASATGTAWQVTALTNVTLQPGQYYLVAEGAGANGVSNIPTPDATGTIFMSATAAKVALVNTTSALSGACPTGAQIIDLVGYGSTASCSETSPAPAPSTTTADVRAGNGCTDTDNNSTDFTATTPVPRNTSSSSTTCSSSSTPTLAINDVSQDEGNTGQTAFTFTVNLSTSTHGGVTFNIATADGTAQDGNPAGEDTDYQANSATGVTIPNGTQSAQFTVQVNGDTTSEPNETFFVNVTSITGATATDGQGQGTIVNDDVTITPIYQIQGSGSTSPLATQNVTTTGIVTGIKQGSSGGFFIQDPSGDGNFNTSDGIFVFTGSSVPASVAIGNSVRVSGTVVEFVPAADPGQKPVTELSSVTVTALSTGNTPPAATTITAAETQVNNLDNLEKYEGMRVSVSSLTVIAPTQGNINEPNATVTSNGNFYGVVTGVARPFREPGISASDALPAGSPCCVPRFDENPERLRVDSDAQPGTTALEVTTGATVTNLVGVLDYSFRTYTILPEAMTPPSVSGNISAIPVPAPNVKEFTIGTFNMQRFFDTTNDPAIGEPVLTTTAFNNRLNKASLAIRNVMLMPDVIGIVEMENLSTLQAVATKVNNDAVAAGGSNPNYVAYLEEGNDPGGIDVGFLVKSSRITVVNVTQFGKDTTYVNPNNSQPELLNDRPPLLLRATVPQQGGGNLPFTVIVNHLRSLSDVDDPTDGNRVRTKRRAQAEYLANLIQARQTADPTENIISVGDYNAFQFNDGFVDVIGTVKGTPTPSDQVVLASSDLVNPDLINLIDQLTPDQRYSFTFDGSAQTLDHELVNQNMYTRFTRIAYARNNADFPQSYYADPSRPERLSDHDMAVAYFSTGAAQSVGSLIISEFRFRGPGPVTPTDTTSPAALNEFIELYNNTNSDITVTTTDDSEGWALVASDGVTRATIPNGTTIPARAHFLITNSNGYSLIDYGGIESSGGDINYTTDIPDGSGIALFRTANPLNFTLSERLDAVGYSTTPALYREGTGFPTGGAEMTGNLEHSFVRTMTTSTSGIPKDTGDNLTDFMPVEVNGTALGLGQRLGAPGPQNRFSPVQHNSGFAVTLLDPMAGSSQPPNRVRDLTPVTNGTNGTLSIRRTFTNNTGLPVTQLRFRIVDITTLPVPSGTADLRALSSPDITVTLTAGDSSTIYGTTLEQPPTQTNGGGWNSSLGAGVINVEAPLSPGASVNLQFLLGVQQTGQFRFFINIEALTESDVVNPRKTTGWKSAVSR